MNVGFVNLLCSFPALFAFGLSFLAAAQLRNPKLATWERYFFVVVCVATFSLGVFFGLALLFISQFGPDTP